MKNALIAALQKEEDGMTDQTERADPGDEGPAEAEEEASVKEDPEPVEGEEEEELTVDNNVD